RPPVENGVPERPPGALGDEVGVQLRVVPEISPVRPEFLVARDRQPGEARRPGLVLPEAAVEPCDQLEIAGRARANPDVGLDRLHCRGLPHGPDVLHAKGQAQPRVGERLVAGRDQGEVTRRPGRDPACCERRVQVANRLTSTVGGRAAGEVHDGAPVAELRVLLDAADHVGDDLVPAERDDAYRAFFALPEELATSEGFSTNALLGFTNMLFKLLADYRPKGVAVAWDTRPVHRHELLDTYKIERKPMPGLLSEQFPFFRPIVEAFGYRNLEFEGWEADDVIATLATLADEAGVKTTVVSTDRDAFQLVSDNVALMMTPRGVSDVHVD